MKIKKLSYSFLLWLAVSPAFSQTQIVAHRGASFLAPENTLASAKLGWKLNADAVEIDIYLSKDGQVVVCHDKTTKRTGGQDLLIAETTAEDLRTLDVGQWKGDQFKGEKIPLLAEVLETVPEGKKLVVEIKCGVEVLPALKKTVEASGKIDQAVFIAFGWETILATKAEFPSNACYWLSSKKEGLPERMEEAANLGLDGVNLHYKIVDQDVVVLADQLDLEVLCWTVDDPDEAKRLVDLGIMAITTNRPAWLKEQMERKD
ncbi:glycerophosphodiester phosphodiesterase [Sunxiuqinia sp. sy24]|uniref:glycerophosphodiester phosphodiesterase n=1 Tax=Sunxiuqinia sp. sy24 TaxID=3461495 RepID=UPI0040456F58